MTKWIGISLPTVATPADDLAVRIHHDRSHRHIPGDQGSTCLLEGMAHCVKISGNGLHGSGKLFEHLVELRTKANTRGDLREHLIRVLINVSADVLNISGRDPKVCE